MNRRCPRPLQAFLKRNIFRFNVTLAPNGTVALLDTVSGGDPVPSQYDRTITPYHTPILHATPAAEWVFALMADARSTPDRAFQFDRSFVTRAPAWSGLTISGTDAAKTGASSRVSSYIVVPSMSTDPATNASAVTGFIFATFSYDDIIRSLTSPRTYFDVVIRDFDSRRLIYGDSVNFTTTPTTFPAYTLRVSDGRVTNVGPGDLHLPSAVADKHLHRITVPRGASSTFAFDIFPHEEYFDQFIDNSAMEGTILFIGICFGVFTFFLLFDFLSRGYFRTHSTALTVQKLQAELGQEHLKQQQLFAGMVASALRAPAATIGAALSEIEAADGGGGGDVKEPQLAPKHQACLRVIGQGSAEIAALVRGRRTVHTRSPCHNLRASACWLTIGCSQLLLQVEDLINTHEDEAPTRFQSNPIVVNPRKCVTHPTAVGLPPALRSPRHVAPLTARTPPPPRYPAGTSSTSPGSPSC